MHKYISYGKGIFKKIFYNLTRTYNVIIQNATESRTKGLDCKIKVI